MQPPLVRCPVFNVALNRCKSVGLLQIGFKDQQNPLSPHPLGTIPSPIMSSSQNPQRTLGDPSSPPSGTVTAKISQEAMQKACEDLERNVQPNDTFKKIRERLKFVWLAVYDAHNEGGDPDIKDRLRNRDEFEAYVEPGSDVERELVELLKKMATNQVPWSNLFENGTSLSAF